MLTAEVGKVLKGHRAQLVWKMEVECLKVGDEKVSAVKMLNHLEAYLTHKDAPQWIKDFQGMINPPDTTAAEATNG